MSRAQEILDHFNALEVAHYRKLRSIDFWHRVRMALVIIIGGGVLIASIIWSIIKHGASQ